MLEKNNSYNLIKFNICPLIFMTVVNLSCVIVPELIHIYQHLYGHLQRPNRLRMCITTIIPVENQAFYRKLCHFRFLTTFSCSICVFRMMTRLQNDIELQFAHFWPPDVSKNLLIVSWTFSALLFCWCPLIDCFWLWQLMRDKLYLLFDLSRLPAYS